MRFRRVFSAFLFALAAALTASAGLTVSPRTAAAIPGCGCDPEDSACLSQCLGCAGSGCNNTGTPCITLTTPCTFNDGPTRCNATTPGNDCTGCSCGEPVKGSNCRCALKT